jgi:hypothetical protein
MKTSSRAGRFKKKLVNAEVLLIEGPLVSAKTAPIQDLFHQSKISAAEFTALSIVVHLSTRYPGDWLGAKHPSHTLPSKLSYPWRDSGLVFEPNIEKRLANFQTLDDIFQHFALKATPLAVNRSILSWSFGSYPLELMFRIPRPEEVLDQQKRCHRCVTVITEEKSLKTYILGERDALSFTMHDLIHADHFYREESVYLGQLGFYGLLDFCLREKHFDELMQNTKFASELEYVISDMNAYAVHLMKCFKSALIHFHEQGEDFFKQWMDKLDPHQDELKAMLELNSPRYEAINQDQHILNFLERWRFKA